MKNCSVCNEYKPISSFYAARGNRDGLSTWCKECQSVKNKEYLEKNRESRRLYMRRYYAENFDTLSKKKSAYMKRTRSDRNKYQRERLKNNVLVALSERCRTRVKKAIKTAGFRKTSITADLLGCSWEELKSHIESKFLPGMSWGNRSEWEIDHIVPVASAKNESDLLKIFHYSNLQPLWAIDNRRKGAKIPHFAC